MHLRRIRPRRCERGARHDDRIRLRQIRTQELPGALAPLVRPVETDVAAPDDARARALRRRDEGGGLGIVDYDDVSGADQREQLAGVLLSDALEVAALGGTELAAVSGGAVEAVVNPLRDREEVGISFDHEPARVDAGAARVREQCLEHLGNAAARPGGVDVQDGAPGESLSRDLGRLLELRHPLDADQRLQPRRVDRLDVDLVEPRALLAAHAARHRPILALRDDPTTPRPLP